MCACVSSLFCAFPQCFVSPAPPPTRVGIGSAHLPSAKTPLSFHKSGQLLPLRLRKPDPLPPLLFPCPSSSRPHPCRGSVPLLTQAPVLHFPWAPRPTPCAQADPFASTPFPISLTGSCQLSLQSQLSITPFRKIPCPVPGWGEGSLWFSPRPLCLLALCLHWRESPATLSFPSEV